MLKLINNINVRLGEVITTNIYMVRHAKSPYVFGEERTRALSEEGEADARKVAEKLVDQEIDVIVSSPYVRTVQTVQEMADHKGITIQEYEELKERPIKGLEFKATEQELNGANRTII